MEEKRQNESPKKTKKRIWELLERMSRGFKVKRRKTTETEWIFKGSDDQKLS